MLVNIAIAIHANRVRIAAGLISGINWAANDMQTKGRTGKSTAVLAVGGSFSAALNNAVASASNAGLFFAVAAGGSNTDNSGSSPGSEPTACTAGSTTIDDAKASSSNYGSLGTPLLFYPPPWLSLPRRKSHRSQANVILLTMLRDSRHLCARSEHRFAVDNERHGHGHHLRDVERSRSYCGSRSVLSVAGRAEGCRGAVRAAKGGCDQGGAYGDSVGDSEFAGL